MVKERGRKGEYPNPKMSAYLSNFVSLSSRFSISIFNLDMYMYYISFMIVFLLEIESKVFFIQIKEIKYPT